MFIARLFSCAILFVIAIFAEDKLLSTKVLIRKAVENGLISKRGTFYYLTKENLPLCENNEDPTLNTAAKYLNLPKHQEIKLMLEAKTNN